MAQSVGKWVYYIFLMHCQQLISSLNNCRSLNACWNYVSRKIFGFTKWESMTLFILGVGRLDLIHILLMYRVKFSRQFCSPECPLLHNLFWFYWSDDYAVVLTLAVNILVIFSTPRWNL
jgi:hypothetical protein